MATYIHVIKLTRMKIINTIQELSIIVLALTTLCILGAEPGTSESSMYEYEHAFDTGHVGWYLGWGWIISLGLLIIVTIIKHYSKIKHWWSQLINYI
jgi:hypothetical protein